MEKRLCYFVTQPLFYKYPNDKAFSEQAILAYQRFRVKNKSALAGERRSYDNVDAILSELDNQFYNVAVSHHKYDPRNKMKKMPSLTSLIQQDAIFRYVDLTKDNDICIFRAEFDWSGIRRRRKGRSKMILAQTRKKQGM